MDKLEFEQLRAEVVRLTAAFEEASADKIRVLIDFNVFKIFFNFKIFYRLSNE